MTRDGAGPHQTESIGSGSARLAPPDEAKGRFGFFAVGDNRLLVVDPV
jgi:hypothetical protein